jgi:hypothetical protein
MILLEKVFPIWADNAPYRAAIRHVTPLLAERRLWAERNDRQPALACQIGGGGWTPASDKRWHPDSQTRTGRCRNPFRGFENR